ncbi:MAG: 2TM domain-containing protein [Cyanobacteria bacterium J06621_3]
MADLYASEEAQQILQIAIAKETEVGELTRTQLGEIAAELNIAPETLLSAEREWHSLKTESVQQSLFNQFKRQRFHHHLMRYGIFNGGLLLLSVAAGSFWFFYFVAITWGCMVLLHGWRAYQSKGYRYQKDFESWQRQQQVKQTVRSFFNRLTKA